jgi:hypothetical protein
MKTQSEIEKRLQKLRKRYRQKYVQERIGRHHENCVHNYVHAPRGQFKYSRSHDVELAPRKQTTLMVIQPEQSIRICTYGSAGKEWNGDVCDSDDKSSDCPWFKAARSEEEVGAEFDAVLADVEFVFENFRDMATLQWVLDVRSPDEVPDEPLPPPSLLDRLLSWFRPKPPQLPPPDPEPEEPVTEPNPDVPKGLWDANPQDP